MACALSGKQDGIRVKADTGHLGDAAARSVGTEGESNAAGSTGSLGGAAGKIKGSVFHIRPQQQCVAPPF